IWSSMVFLLSKKPLWTAKVLSIVNRPDGSLADHWSQLGLFIESLFTGSNVNFLPKPGLRTCHII
ncbi:MAG: hypothetical protein AB1631_27600, partial [Acidobacteriota bacterium]